MRILAVDTATEACSAALYIDDEIIAEYQLAPREHTQLILQMVSSLLQQADISMSGLDALAFGRGPGSFTGVRIATGIVQGLAFASDLPVVPISTLASIAQRVAQDHQHKSVISAIDARMGEVYWGCYQLAENGLMTLRGSEQISAPEGLELTDTGTDWSGAGTAWGAYYEALSRTLGQQLNHSYADYLPDSRSIVQLAVFDYQQGLAVDAARAQPVYLRNNVAKKSTKKPDRY
ncbi:MAG TPA: tRNA (adenosine(37)-N6)-threonylcarbamoyltransferase complex dimerization subunit type 1 TsaB [Gammaproteobacteria bacterium]|nr:tRNA (adenosine(37)-N6)-threonylcarbamoyltransferase complex dimerization subunit type 1 TsaB [Gammaproteobacteria bacterium]